VARGGRNHWAAGDLDTGPPTEPPPVGGLPSPGPHALFSPTTSATRLGIDWTTAHITGSKLTSAMLGSTGAPYAAISDSGCSTYWPSASEPGRITITSNGFSPGTYTFPCPPGAQPSVSGSDGPIQIAVADGRWVDCYAVSGNFVNWNGNTGTCTVSGITVKNWQTGTGWPSGTTSNVNKFGFAACGASVCAGALTAEDKKLVLAGGGIAHAAALVLNNSGLANGPILPALRDDTPGYPSGNTIFHQGTLLALPPGITRPGGWTAWEHAIADMFENFGGYVMDRSGGWVLRCNARAEPGAGTTLTSSDFAGFMSMTAGKLGKFLFDNLRWVTGAKPSIPHA
jgi:hypothetical protein